MIYAYSTELAHHGIKGQKWGVRRFQNEDGTYTEEGKKRYFNSDGTLNDAGKKFEAKQEKKAKHHDALVKYYELDPATKDNAEDLAKKHEKIEKAAKVGLAVVGTALVAYGAYRLGDEYLDRTIKAGKEMSTVHFGDGASRLKNAPFYMAWKKNDVDSYSSTIFAHLNDQSNITKFSSTKNLKMASSGSQRKAFNELLKNDSDFRRYIDNNIHPLKSSIHNNDFDKFSYMLVKRGSSAENQKNVDKYYDLLKKKGYSGLIDREDSIIEKWTHNPGILIDSSNLVAKSTTKVDMSQAQAKASKATVSALIRGKSMDTKSVLKGVGIASSILGMPLLESKIADSIYSKKNASKEREADPVDKKKKNK